jgi:protein-S-isoprenylcysteine O-methyltransferase Ste14
MIVKLGNFLFHNRNGIFPFFYMLLFIPSPELFANPLFAVLIGLTISALGQMIRVLTIGLVYIMRGGKDRRIFADGLVTTGIFTHVRNPLYVGNALVLVGLGIASNSILFNCMATPLFLFFWHAIVHAEERYLFDKFGELYSNYCDNVNRWIPKFSGFAKTLKSMRFNWKRVVIREYNSTYIWMTGAVLIVLKHSYLHSTLYKFNSVKSIVIIVLILLFLLYLTARYLKKSGKLKSD